MRCSHFAVKIKIAQLMTRHLLRSQVTDLLGAKMKRKCLTRKDCEIITMRVHVHTCAKTLEKNDGNLEKLSAELMPRSFHEYFPPRGTRARMAALHHATYVRTLWSYWGGLFRNNAVVRKYFWKQYGRDLTFWDSSGSVSFFVYRRMYRDRRPRYLMQKRRCIPRDEFGRCDLFSMCAFLLAAASARVSLCVIICPRIITARTRREDGLLGNFCCSFSETRRVKKLACYNPLHLREITLHIVGICRRI